MDRQERDLISDLFGKLARLEGQAPPRDREAEAFIRDQLARQPGAPYYMAQTIIMQERALEAAQARLDELERGAGRGGAFSGPWGQAGRGRSATLGYSSGVGAMGGAGPFARPGYGGGGFLAGAAQTAMGVAGGVLLGSMLADWIDGSETGGDAGDLAADAGAAADAEPVDTSDADFGGDGGFDIGEI